MKTVIDSAFFHRLEQEIYDTYSTEDATHLVPFAKEIFHLYPVEELTERPMKAIAGVIHDFWYFMQKVDLSEPVILIYDSSVENERHESKYTNIFVLYRDMPFLVDSILMELNSRGLNVSTIKNNIFNVLRDSDGELITALAESGAEGVSREAGIFIQIDFSSSEQYHEELKQALTAVLGDVAAVTDDYHPMLARTEEAIADLTSSPGFTDNPDIAEAAAFLEWIKSGNFVFLGCCEYHLNDKKDALILNDAPERQLGIFRRHQRNVKTITISDSNPGLQAFYESDVPLVFNKSSVYSRVHRRAYSDYIVMKRYDKAGNTIGEYRFMGLYASPTYKLSPFSIPMIREKVKQLMLRPDLVPGSHGDKALRQIIDMHPRDELFHSSVDELYDTLISIWQINERRMVRMFIRPDPFEKFVSCIVYMPRDIYTTDIRIQIEELLKDELDATECEFTTFFSESVLARTHYILKITSDRYRQIDRKAIENRVIRFTRDWYDDLVDAAVAHWGGDKGREIANRYRGNFPSSYRDNFEPQIAVKDIELFTSLELGDELAMSFYQPAGGAKNVMRFKLFHCQSQLELSKMVPMIEKLGFRVLGEHPYRITTALGETVWLHDFTLLFGLDVDVDVSAIRNTFEEAFAAVSRNETESDSFNRLVLGARLDWRMVSVLRLYARYMKQLGAAMSQSFIADTLVDNLEITRNIVALFRCYFDPKLVGPNRAESDRPDRLNQKILDALDQVSNLNEDQVLRSYLQLVNATVRTNFFQLNSQGKSKSYISVKLSPREIADAPEPRPLFEIFVYSPRFEGVHLRGGKVARGGIRWSDRQEDYRTEVLGLVKAQQVKNSVIVPTGAKGGFVAKQIDRSCSRELVLKEGISCYQLFMRGLLDMTDNIIDGEVVQPVNVICRDDDDPYLVVAADKGTAAFSDIANTISEEYGHWLGDAYASGGSHGYDHKAMGITAKGAWVAVQRHFRELGLNTQTDPFTVIGIGDMAGDVFGNGMLLSRKIKLLAAFNHQHIFIDPNPDPESSFTERERLFVTPGTSWGDYEDKLISQGGGVYSRSAKSIALSPQIKACFNIQENQLSPNLLIKKILQAEVDLIWNGGIGTYVKAHSETHLDVGDRANDALRVNGKDLRCRVFGEGGNLGLTQRGRIEFSLHGGACNTDFIDNAGGVDCSDREVNIKILLNKLVVSKDITHKQRNQILESMTDEVSELVLSNNYHQTLALSLASYLCKKNFPEYSRCMQDWEAQGRLDRALEYLPDDEALAEREKQQLSLMRPELSVLVSYAKIILKEALLESDVPEDNYIAKIIVKGFPEKLVKQYPSEVHNHSLRREIISNQIANEVVNRMGITYCQRQSKSTGATISDVVKAYVVVRDSLNLDQVWEEIVALDYKAPSDLQHELFSAVIRLGRRTSRWVLRNRRASFSPQDEIENFEPKLTELRKLLSSFYNEESLLLWQAEVDRLTSQGVGKLAATLLASSNNLYFGFGISDISIRTGKSMSLVAKTYFDLGDELDLGWFSKQIVTLNPRTRWEDFARESYVDDLEHQRRALTNTLLKNVSTVEELPSVLQDWRDRNKPLIDRWSTMIKELRAAPDGDFSMYSVALRELLDLVQASENVDS